MLGIQCAISVERRNENSVFARFEDEQNFSRQKRRAMNREKTWSVFLVFHCELILFNLCGSTKTKLFFSERRQLKDDVWSEKRRLKRYVYDSQTLLYHHHRHHCVLTYFFPSPPVSSERRRGTTSNDIDSPLSRRFLSLCFFCLFHCCSRRRYMPKDIRGRNRKHVRALVSVRTRKTRENHTKKSIALNRESDEEPSSGVGFEW